MSAAMGKAAAVLLALLLILGACVNHAGPSAEPAPTEATAPPMGPLQRALVEKTEWPVVVSGEISRVNHEQDLETRRPVLEEAEGAWRLSFTDDAERWDGGCIALGGGRVLGWNRYALYLLDTVGGQLLDPPGFRRPAEPHEIADVVRDPATGELAVLYNVSHYTGTREHELFYEEAVQMVQLLDGNGAFLREFATGYRPYTDEENRTVSCGPCTLRDGQLTFRAGPSYMDFYAFLNTETGAVETVAAREVAAVDGYFLISDGGVKDGVGTDVYTFSLYQGSERLAGVDVPMEDMGFRNPENRFYDGQKIKQFRFDPATWTARVGNDKITYVLRFREGDYEVERHYNRGHLEIKLATSRDGRYEIHLADSGGAGDGFWGDIVALDTETDAINFLTDTYAGGDVAFLTDTRLLVNRLDSLLLIDVATAEVLDPMFALDCVALDCYITGIAYAGGGNVLVAWRAPQQGESADPEKELPLHLELYDVEGKLVRDVETGMTVPAFYKNWVAQTNLRLDGKGNVVISTSEGKLGTLYYG